MTHDPAVHLSLEHEHDRLESGDALSGTYRLLNVEKADVTAVEISVLWHTEGKGDEDFGVHFFKRYSQAEGDYIDPRLPGRFSTLLPSTPLSYEGVIIKIRWCVRVRMFLARGREVTAERQFRLGKVPAGRAVLG